MRIITNADDFGLDDDTTRATIECLDAGSLTSATIMPKMPSTAAAIAYAISHPEKSFGVHLTFVCDTVESPLAPPDQVRSLLAPDGRFLPSQTVRKMALAGRIPVAHIEAEITAQISFLRDSGIPISHVDSHGHLHKFAPFRRALQTVLPRFGITRVRGVQNLYIRKPLKSPTFWFGPIWRGRLRRLFTMPDDFYMSSSAAGDTDWAAAVLGRGRGKSLEVGVHPGYSESWRNAERLAVHSLAKLARRQGHEMIGWKDL